MAKTDPDTGQPIIGADGKPVTEQQEVSIPAFKVVSVFDVSQTEGKELPDGSLVMGMPARVKRTLSDEEIAHLCTAAGDEYLAVGARMLEEGLLHNPEPGTDVHPSF